MVLSTLYYHPTKIVYLRGLSPADRGNQGNLIIGIDPFMVLGIIVVDRNGHGGQFIELRIGVAQRFLEFPDRCGNLSARDTCSGNGQGGTSNDFLGDSKQKYCHKFFLFLVCYWVFWPDRMVRSWVLFQSLKLPNFNQSDSILTRPPSL